MKQYLWLLPGIYSDIFMLFQFFNFFLVVDEHNTLFIYFYLVLRVIKPSAS